MVMKKKFHPLRSRWHHRSSHCTFPKLAAIFCLSLLLRAFLSRDNGAFKFHRGSFVGARCSHLGGFGAAHGMAVDPNHPTHPSWLPPQLIQAWPNVYPTSNPLVCWLWSSGTKRGQQRDSEVNASYPILLTIIDHCQPGAGVTHA